MHFATLFGCILWDWHDVFAALAGCILWPWLDVFCRTGCILWPWLDVFSRCILRSWLDVFCGPSWIYFVGLAGCIFWILAGWPAWMYFVGLADVFCSPDLMSFQAWLEVF